MYMYSEFSLSGKLSTRVWEGLDVQCSDKKVSDILSTSPTLIRTSQARIHR